MIFSLQFHAEPPAKPQRKKKTIKGGIIQSVVFHRSYGIYTTIVALFNVYLNIRMSNLHLFLHNKLSLTNLALHCLGFVSLFAALFVSFVA